MEAFIFEDETVARVDIEEVCQKFGIQTPGSLSFVSSEEALVYIEQQEHHLDDIYVAVLDIKDDAFTGEPAQKAGIRIAEAIRSKNPSIPIVFYTGLSDIERKGRLLDGPYGIVYKNDLPRLQQVIVEQIPTLPPRVPALQAGLFSYEREGTTFFFNVRDILFVERVSADFEVVCVPKADQPITTDFRKEQSWKKIQHARKWAHGGHIVLRKDGEEPEELYQIKLNKEVSTQDVARFISDLGVACSQPKFTRRNIESLIDEHVFLIQDKTTHIEDYLPQIKDDGNFHAPAITKGAHRSGNRTTIIVDTVKEEVVFWRLRTTPWNFLLIYVKEGKTIREIPVANLTISELAKQIEAMRTFSKLDLSYHDYCILNLKYLKKAYVTSYSASLIIRIPDGEERTFTGQYGNILGVIRNGKTIQI